MTYDLAAEERAKRRYYFIAVPVALAALFPAIALGFRFLPAHLRMWPALTLAAAGFAVAEAWAFRQGWRAMAGTLATAAVVAGLWVWWRGSP